MPGYYPPPPPFVGGRAPLEPRRLTPPEPDLPPPFVSQVPWLVDSIATNYGPWIPYLQARPYQARLGIPAEPPLPPSPRLDGLLSLVLASWAVPSWPILSGSKLIATP